MPTINPTDFKARIERLYLAHHPRERSPHGCQIWFSETSGLSTKTIYSYTQGNRTIEGPVVALVECMEREVGDVLKFHEMRRVDYYQKRRAAEQKRAKNESKAQSQGEATVNVKRQA